MTTATTADKELLSELFELLTSGLLEAQDLQTALSEFDTEVTSALQYGCGEPMALAASLKFALANHCATGDKLDELHEQVVEMFGGELPDFPVSSPKMTTPDYFRWLDTNLTNWSEDGGYEALSLDGHGGEDLCLFAVRRQDTDRVLHLAQTLGLRIERPLDVWHAMGA